jgi:hypothetical protein
VGRDRGDGQPDAEGRAAAALALDLEAPPWASTASLAIGSPRPVPWSGDFVEKNGSKMRAFTSGGIPGPLSWISMMRSPSFFFARASTRPTKPSRTEAAWIAFTSRLVSACSSRLRAPGMTGRSGSTTMSMRTLSRASGAMRRTHERSASPTFTVALA